MSAAFIVRLKKAAFPEPDLRSLVRLALPVRSYSAHANIIQENAPATLLLMVEGWAVRTKFLADGRRQLPAIYVPGDLCNLDSLFASRNFFSIAALTSCVVAILPIERVRDVAEHSAVIRNLLWRLTIVSSAVSTEWLLSLGRRSTRERLAHLLLELHARLDSVGLADDHSFPLPLTQQDLGDILGVSSVHINRTFQSFRSEGLITFKGRRLILSDFDKLREVADFNPEYLSMCW
jgi:CRP-like cAMP-binding protein